MEHIHRRVQEMYAGNQEQYEAFLAVLDDSLHPRSPEMLYEKFQDLGPTRESLVLDLGCRHAVQACALAQRVGCRVIGVDLVWDNLQEAKRHIAAQQLEHSVHIVQGDLQHVPMTDNLFDVIWCRDVLTHIPDLHQAFTDCARVLKPHGKMLIFHVVHTELLTQDELVRLCAPLATIPDNLVRTTFEQAFTSAGFSLVEADVLSSEWREYGEESGSQITSKQLLRLARMHRNRARLIAEFGEHDYACELANCSWGVYQMLGKLCPIVYTLTT